MKQKSRCVRESSIRWWGISIRISGLWLSWMSFIVYLFAMEHAEYVRMRKEQRADSVQDRSKDCHDELREYDVVCVTTLRYLCLEQTVESLFRV